MDFIISIMRYVAPSAAAIILITSVISLFRNRPRVHKLARLVNQFDGSIIDIDHWETSIGKSKSNDIVLRYPGVTRFHAVIAKKRRDWVLTNATDPEPNIITRLLPEALSSLINGRSQVVPIYVNGKQTEGKTVLENGDTIKIGEIPLRFECDEAISVESREQIRSAARAVNSNVAYGVLVDIKTKRPVYLKKQDVLIGRGRDCDIQIMSQMVSSNHARIHRTSRGWAVSDLDSHNGTKLNGRYINQPQLIFDEDMLTFGDKVFIFYEQ